MNEPEWNDKEMMYLSSNHEGEQIQDMARGMSQVEVADFFGVEMKELSESAEDFKFFKYHYKMGRASGNRQAISALFKQMDQRSGGQVALSYLARFAEDFKGEVEADGEVGRNKSFRIILD